MATVIDLFDRFLAWWSSRRRTGAVAWQALYAEPWVELLDLQIAAYEEDGLDWRQVAQERIEPNLASWLPAMASARANLLRAAEPTYEAAERRLGIDFDVVFVVYVGIGVGAGWATTFGGHPACLHGLEKLAELDWTDTDTLAALCAHELGHLAHQQWRLRSGRNGLAAGYSPLWHLYEEGFAMRCEHIVMGRESWHEQKGQPGWRQWCEDNRARLVREFLRRVERGDDARDFFGDWYDIDGYKQCGYYLGHEMVKRMEDDGPTLREIAVLPLADAERLATRHLEALARP